jgi:hypothetical protein
LQGNESALMMATEADDIHIVRFLIKHGADVNAPGKVTAKACTDSRARYPTRFCGIVVRSAEWCNTSASCVLVLQQQPRSEDSA